MTAAIDIGNIYATICTHEAMPRFRDQHATLASYNAAALSECQLDHASIQTVLLCPLLGRSGWLDLGQVHDLSF